MGHRARSVSVTILVDDLVGGGNGVLDVQRVVAGHCTGFRASAKLAQALGKRFDPGSTGLRIKL